VHAETPPPAGAQGFGDTDPSSAETGAIESAGVRDIAAGGYHSCAVSARGAVYCWGYNTAGQVGDGTFVSQRLQPVPVTGLEGPFRAVAAGWDFSCALSEAGRVFCWGANGAGQLGDGTRMGSAVPRAVLGLGSGVRAIAAGEGHACAIVASGNLFCWGGNSSGQVGDGTFSDRDTPARVQGLRADVTSVGTGYDHTCAIDRGGRATCWGGNSYYQLGDGTRTDRAVPTPVASLARAGIIAAGARHSCATLRTGRVVCWGSNAAGELGDGTTTGSLVPVRTRRLGAGVRALVAGGFSWAGNLSGGFNCALNERGQAFCWGSNGEGQLGDRSTTSRSLPVRVSRFGEDVTKIAVGSNRHSCGINRLGRAFCWGSNLEGQLGTGNRSDSIVPAAVAGRLHRQ
jgi:alpha-tubulin suppressor-like RCC1 family protein